MKIKNFFYYVLSLIVFAILFQSCGVGKFTVEERKYFDVNKEDESITMTYKLPIVKPVGNTRQTQRKGKVKISVEIVPFRATRNVVNSREITYADPDLPGYDRYVITNKPTYSVTPKNLRFKIRVRNNAHVPLKLNEVGIALLVDGTQWSFPSNYLRDWNRSMILTGFEKEFIIEGPQINEIYSGKVIDLFLNGVPTSFNSAGRVTRKSNFEWYFKYAVNTVKKNETVSYTYETEPIYKEKCHSCGGTGVDPKNYKCTYCNGKGRVKNKKGKYEKCYNCSGKGYVNYKCEKCNGVGTIEYPKSKEAPYTSTFWAGWPVIVSTIPTGAKVKMVDTKTAGYKIVGYSNVESNWFSNASKTYPIIVEYQDQKVKVLPYNKEGEEISKVIIDFSGGYPVVKEGEKVQ